MNLNTNTLKAKDCIVTIELKNATYNTFNLGSITISQPTVGMIAHELYQAIHKLFASERLILDPAEKEGFGFNDFKNAWDDFERSRT